MEKGYYLNSVRPFTCVVALVAIHNKNGKGLLRIEVYLPQQIDKVAIHNKNGKGLLLSKALSIANRKKRSQSTIKMEKGYYIKCITTYYYARHKVAIHNKNGKGLLLDYLVFQLLYLCCRNPQ